MDSEIPIVGSGIGPVDGTDPIVSTADPKPVLIRRPGFIRERDGIRGMVPDRQHAAKDKVYGEYLGALDPENNAEVRMALALSEDNRFQEFLSRLGQKIGGRAISLQAIAKACNIDMLEFAKFIQKRGVMAAVARAQLGVDAVVRDMVSDAGSVADACPRCDGLGWVGAPSGLPLDVKGYKPVELDGEPKWIRDCPKCAGAGSIRSVGDGHARDKVLEIAGLTGNKKGGGVTVNVGMGASHASAVGGSLSSLTIDVPAISLDDEDE